MTPTPNTKPKRDHAAIADGYARAVIAGEIAACKWVRKAAERHLRDLERPDFLYRFDSNAGAKVCRFIETLDHTKGEWAKRREKLILQPWQCFLVVCLFGWLHRETGRRRFRIAYWEIPRKNGKSPLAAAIGLYMFVADGEFGAEVYSGATTEKQAWEVFKPAKLMLERNQHLQDYFGAEPCAKVLVKQRDASKFEPVIGNPGDGSSPSCAIIDEYHEHNTSALYDTMETGMGARAQPLLLIITTAGFNIAGPCHDKRDEVCKVLDGIFENEQLFGVIFGLDEEDDWAVPNSLIKANPNYGISVDADYLLTRQRQALFSVAEQTKFKTKHLNVWCSVASGCFDMQLWALAEDKLLDEGELLGCDCFFGDDLASKLDLCAHQRLYRKLIGGKQHYYLFGRYWLPEAAIEEPGPNHAYYARWVSQGFLTPTEGATVDFEFITEQVIEDALRIKPLEIVYDPFNATQFAQGIMAEGFQNVVEFQQKPWNFSLPVDEINAALKDGRFHHDGNPITAWCFSNCVAKASKKGMFSPIKAKQHQKIDGAIAAIMAMARATVQEPTPTYEVAFV
jgi:phage terminase large subunit-like protein